MTDLLIQNCLVLRIPNRTTAIVDEGQDILIRGNRITAIQTTGLADPSHFREAIDASGLLAMPGLINTHAHVPMVLFRGLAEDVPLDRWFNEYIWPLEHNLQPGDVGLGMELGLAELIRGGVTTVADHYFNMHEAAAAVEKSGARAVLGWAIFGTGGEEALDNSVQFCQQWQGAADGRITTLLAPHAPYTCPDDFLRMVAVAARETDLNIHIHAAETLDQTRASVEKTGRTPIQILEDTGLLDRPTIVAHACGATDDDIAILAKHGASVAHCPKTYLKLGMELTRVTAMHAAGVHVGLGTDGAVSNNTLNILEAMRLLALLQKDRAHTAEVMPVAEALYTATRGGAYALGMGDELGALEPGFLADIALLDLSGLHHQPLHNPAASLVYNADTHDVHTVVINGKVVMRRKRVLNIDVTDVLERARRSMARLSQRDPAQRIQTYAP